MPKTKQPEWWTNRIVKYGEMPANQFLAHEMNARRHPAKQREALRGSLDSVGWIAPVLVSSKTGKMLDGHARIEEALSRDEAMGVPFVEVDVSEEEERLILATLDPITELATYDKEALDSLLREVSTGNAALMEMLSKQAEEHGLMPLLNGNAPGAGGDDFDTTPEETQTRVEYGDLWQCGEHRVLCGDSTKAEDVARVMAGEKADMVFTDPPYGINYIAMRGADKIANDQNEATAKAVTTAALVHHRDAASLFVCCDWRSLPVILDAMLDANIEPKACIVWDKMRGVQNLDRYHKQHEFVLYSGPYGGEETQCGDVWQFQRDFDPDHPTPKPVGLVERAISTASSHGEIVADPLGGSGTTLIACERTNRKARVMEIEPKYVNVILSRWEAETGKQAQLLERLS